MGTLSKIREIFENIIEKLYREGQLHGEKKKINDSRRVEIYNEVNLTNEQKKKIDIFFQENYGQRVPDLWHRLYQSFTGHFDEKYLPEYLFSSLIEPSWNSKKYRDALSDKNLLGIYCTGLDNVRQPIIFGSYVSGLYRDCKLNVISFSEFLTSIEEVGEAVIKPTVESGSGKNIQFVNLKNGFDLYSKKSIYTIIKEYNGDFNIQECIKNSEILSKIYPKSVNTFRIITYIWGGKIHHMPVSLRIGQGGNRLDNAHAGGMFIGVDDDGSLSSCAFTEFKKVFHTHPDTGFVFEGYLIPQVPFLIQAAKKMHARVPQLKIMSWDLTLDKDDGIILVEVNTIGQTVWFPQMANGKSAFGNNTAEILQSFNSVSRKQKK